MRACVRALQLNYRIGDPILHIELRRWADIVLIAPCSANTLAKIATGVCDNLVVSPPSLPPTLSSFPSVPSPISSHNMT
jgi:phosphopantothenoylcysteine decarboxylase